MSLDLPTSPPVAGSPAAQAHQKLAELRRLTTRHPREMALQTQRLTESWVRRLLVLALVTEQWPTATLDMMTAPPEPDYRAIADENQRLRDEFAEAERRAQVQDHTVSFAEEAA